MIDIKSGDWVTVEVPDDMSGATWYLENLGEHKTRPVRVIGTTGSSVDIDACLVPKSWCRVVPRPFKVGDRVRLKEPGAWEETNNETAIIEEIDDDNIAKLDQPLTRRSLEARDYTYHTCHLKHADEQPNEKETKVGIEIEVKKTVEAGSVSLSYDENDDLSVSVYSTDNELICRKEKQWFPWVCFDSSALPDEIKIGITTGNIINWVPPTARQLENWIRGAK